MNLTVDLLEDVASPVSAEQFQATLLPILTEHAPAELTDVTIEILTTQDEQMRELNRTHRSKDATTDVLSLPTAIDSEQGSVVPASEQPTHLGTIVISIPQAERQIGHFGETLEAEILGLATHGLRHLLGHDHDKEGNWQ